MAAAADQIRATRTGTTPRRAERAARTAAAQALATERLSLIEEGARLRLVDGGQEWAAACAVTRSAGWRSRPAVVRQVVLSEDGAWSLAAAAAHAEHC